MPKQQCKGTVTLDFRKKITNRKGQFIDWGEPERFVLTDVLFFIEDLRDYDGTFAVRSYGLNPDARGGRIKPDDDVTFGVIAEGGESAKEDE